ncbi:MAG TPA: DmsE family decaheme c-type cytochrome [Candidatus Angelobacter sp.]|nr:DmsE family decaheme c-type cytochrome [Candidatus Angelobacter sp.]
MTSIRPSLWHKIAFVFVLSCIGRATFIFAQSQPAPAKLPPVYMGSESCKDCHADLYKSFATTPHWKIAFDKRDAATAAGQCESCHGPGREHVQSGGDPAKIVSFKGASADKISATCLTCHQYGEEHSNFLRSAHKNSDVNCLDCHSPHHYKESQYLLVKSQPQLCYGCHSETKSDFAKPFHHRVDEKLIKCTDCHNQHGGFVNAQLRTTASQDAVCLKCHVEKAGPFVFEHAPQLTEGCTSCHVPHGSANPRLLTRSNVNQLCLECHTVTFGSNVRDTPGYHDQAAQFQACTLCHSSIHGSNFNQFFFK